MNIILGILIGILILTILIILHELGHFWAARRNGVHVTEFGIGFPPRAIAWIKKSGRWQRLSKSESTKNSKSLVLSLNWLPLGGFCAMKGENASDQRPHTFGSASFWQKTKILFAGVAMNWLTAFLILTILALAGLPKFFPNQFFLESDLKIHKGSVVVSKIHPDSPAIQANFSIGDQILKANQSPINNVEQLLKFNQDHAGQSVTYLVRRENQEITLKTTLNPLAKDQILLGIAMHQTPDIYQSSWSAPIVGAITTAQLTAETFKGLGQMLWQLSSGLIRQFNFNPAVRAEGQADLDRASKSVSGPIGIIGGIFPTFLAAGPTELAFLTAIISISLACMNILPIPALDGGRWLLIAIYRLRNKTLDQETETKIVGRAFIFLIGLIIFITIIDVLRFL